MLERPPEISDDDVLDAVRRHWRTEVTAVEHLAVGFGAHHWRAAPGLFVTLDDPGALHHDAASLEGAYAAAAALGFEFVIAPLAARDGAYTVALGERRLSCMPWVAGEVAGDGPVVGEDLARANLDALARLHAAPPPASIPRWAPRVAELTFAAGPWVGGPHGEAARAAIEQRLAAIERWLARYHRLVAQAAAREWVPTHGEPHSSNQLITDAGVRFVDWESLALAPRERDLRPLIDAGYADALAPDWEMVELFDLEWRLDEIGQYAAWFSGPHGDGADDRIAFGGLRGELERDEFQRIV